MENQSHNIRQIIGPDDLDTRVSQIAAQVQDDLLQGPITLVPILDGAFIFAADLARNFKDVSLELCFYKAKSYKGNQSGKLTTYDPLLDPAKITGRNVLIVDDILDTGKTLSALQDKLSQLDPKSVKTCVLLAKERSRQGDLDIKADYIGFEIPDVFVVGYGLDYNGLYRNLPFIGEMT